jgi:hypothetical protein
VNEDFTTSQRKLQDDAYDLLGRYTGYLDRKARGPKLRKAARELGLGVKRSHSLPSLIDAYGTVLHGTQDAERCHLLAVDAGKVLALRTMHAELVAALPTAGQKSSDQAASIAEVDRLQMVLEVFFGDVAAAADWHLTGEERLQLVRLIPRVEAGRSKKPQAPADIATVETPDAEPA